MAVEGPTDKGDQAIAPYVAVSRFARPGKCNAKIAGRAGPKREFISARTKSANHQISFENADGGTEQVAGESTTDAKARLRQRSGGSQIPMAAQP